MSRSAAREARAGAAALILGGPSSAAAQGLARAAVEALLPPHAGPAQLRDGVGAGASSGAESRLRPRPLAVQPRNRRSRAWRSDTDVTGSPLRTVKDRKFLRVRAPKSEWLRHIHRRRLRLGHPTGKGDRGSPRQGPNRLRPRRRLRALRPRPQRRAAHQSFSWVKRIAAHAGRTRGLAL